MTTVTIFKNECSSKMFTVWLYLYSRRKFIPILQYVNWMSSLSLFKSIEDTNLLLFHSFFFAIPFALIYIFYRNETICNAHYQETLITYTDTYKQLLSYNMQKKFLLTNEWNYIIQYIQIIYSFIPSWIIIIHNIIKNSILYIIRIRNVVRMHVVSFPLLDCN